jgi:hypothetical protein
MAPGLESRRLRDVTGAEQTDVARLVGSEELAVPEVMQRVTYFDRVDAHEGRDTIRLESELDLTFYLGWGCGDVDEVIDPSAKDVPSSVFERHDRAHREYAPWSTFGT